MNKKSIIVLSAFLAVSVLLAGCRLASSDREEYDGYSRVLYSDTGEEASEDYNEELVENGSKREESKKTDSKTSKADEKDKDTDSQGAETVTVITEKTTTTYYYTEYSEEDTDEGGMNIVDDNSHHNTDTASDTASDTDTDVSTESDSDSDTDIDVSSDTQTYSGTDSDTQTDSENTDSEVRHFTEADLDFVINGERVKLGDNISDVLPMLGEPLNISELPMGGSSYSFDGFTVNTAANGEEQIETVVSVEIFSDTIETEKYVRVGMTAEEACAVYGEDYLQYEDEYRYYIDNKYMYFYVQNGIVANIGYSIDSELE